VNDHFRLVGARDRIASACPSIGFTSTLADATELSIQAMKSHVRMSPVAKLAVLSSVTPPKVLPRTRQAHHPAASPLGSRSDYAEPSDSSALGNQAAAMLRSA
jgi:hypothetical protein